LKDIIWNGRHVFIKLQGHENKKRVRKCSIVWESIKKWRLKVKCVSGLDLGPDNKKRHFCTLGTIGIESVGCIVALYQC